VAAGQDARHCSHDHTPTAAERRVFVVAEKNPQFVTSVP
jgi:hypothetical protein